MDRKTGKDIKMNVFKKVGSRYWHYRFMVNGKRYRGTTKRTNQADARRVMMQEYNRVLDVRQHGEKPEITLGDACRLAINSVQGRTAESYQYATNKLLGLNESFAGCWSLEPSRLLSTLTDSDLDEHRVARLAEGRKPNTINLEIRFLKRVNNLCRKRHKTNPDLDFQMLKGFVKSRSISPQEELAVITYCHNKERKYGGGAWQKAHDLFVYLLDTGVRLNEALSIEWAEIDLNDRMIENWNQKSKKAVFVPISDRVAVALEGRLGQPRPFMSMDRAVRNLREAIRNCCRSTDRINEEKGKATIHSCRDTYATRLLNEGMALEKVSHLLGHATLQQTQKYARFAKRPAAAEARAILNRQRQ